MTKRSNIRKLHFSYNRDNSEDSVFYSKNQVRKTIITPETAKKWPLKSTNSMLWIGAGNIRFY